MYMYIGSRGLEEWLLKNNNKRIRISISGWFFIWQDKGRRFNVDNRGWQKDNVDPRKSLREYMEDSNKRRHRNRCNISR